MNLDKNATLKMCILWKIRLWKCEFCEKWDFENVNFAKNEILKLWISWKVRFSKCEFSDKSDFCPSVNFANYGITKSHILLTLQMFLLHSTFRPDCLCTTICLPTSPRTREQTTRSLPRITMRNGLGFGFPCSHFLSPGLMEKFPMSLLGLWQSKM